MELPLNTVSLRRIHVMVGGMLWCILIPTTPGLPPLAPVSLCLTDESCVGEPLAQRRYIIFGRLRYYAFSVGRPNHEPNGLIHTLKHIFLGLVRPVFEPV